MRFVAVSARRATSARPPQRTFSGRDEASALLFGGLS